MAKIKGWKVWGEETKGKRKIKIWVGEGKRAPEVRLQHVYYNDAIPLFWKVETWNRDKLKLKERVFETQKEAKKYAISFMKKYK